MSNEGKKKRASGARKPANKKQDVKQEVAVKTTLEPVTQAEALEVIINSDSVFGIVSEGRFITEPCEISVENKTVVCNSNVITEHELDILREAGAIILLTTSESAMLEKLESTDGPIQMEHDVNASEDAYESIKNDQARENAPDSNPDESGHQSEYETVAENKDAPEAIKTIHIDKVLSQDELNAELRKLQGLPNNEYDRRAVILFDLIKTRNVRMLDRNMQKELEYCYNNIFRLNEKIQGCDICAARMYKAVKKYLVRKKYVTNDEA